AGLFIGLLETNPAAHRFFEDYAQRMQMRNRLFRTPLFANENEVVIGRIIDKLAVRKYKKGDEIIRQGDQGNEFFILWEGSVGVYLDVPGERKLITTLSAPNSFGELALVSDRPRANSIYAIDRVTVYTLRKEDFLPIVKRDYGLFDRLLNQIYERQRPVKSGDITVTEEWKGGERLFVLRQNVTGQYMRLDEKALFVLNEMDGSKSIQEIAVSYFQKFREIGVGSLLQLLPMLIEKGFVEIPELRDEMKVAKKRTFSQRVYGILQKLFFINLISFPAEGPMKALYNAVGGKIFSKPVYFFMSVIAVAGLSSFVYGSATGGISPGGITAAGFVSFIVMFLMHGVFHETAHALTAVRHGVRIGDFGIGLLLMIFVTPHVRTTDMWMIDKRQRIVISWAGPFMTAVLSGTVSLGIWILPGAVRADMSMFALMGYLIVLTSLNPLVLSDGYYMLMDFFQIPGLRFKSVQFIRFGLWGAIKSGLHKEHWLLLSYSLFSLVYITAVLVYAAVDVRIKLIAYLQPLMGAGISGFVSNSIVAIVFILSLLSILRPLMGKAGEGSDVV
ncbi:MAG TPA: cyclic nucleotide-binding domain-containing protein, partial [Spirochaetota bacterium]|nr:cyclic nucleotide-binding domain-containing protein [Spirochaetota bacterium]